jgi:hypothetical protein
MVARRRTYMLVAVAVAAAATSACHSAASGEADSPTSCATYNTGKINGHRYIANSDALSALLLSHSINPAANHHYEQSAGSSIMNISVASQEVDRYCASNPDSTIDKGVRWSNFNTQ